MLPKVAIASASFFANLLALGGILGCNEAFGWQAAIAAVLLLGFCIGCVLGSAFKAATPAAVSLGAFSAALLMWLPVVIVTYGFALLGLPLLIVYAACVWTGARIMRRAAVIPPRSS